jgi:hypothetical protein
MLTRNASNKKRKIRRLYSDLRFGSIEGRLRVLPHPASLKKMKFNTGVTKIAVASIEESA